MVPPALSPEPLFDIDPQTGATIEVFYADRTLETFGRGGAGWFWWCRRRGFAPDGQATGPFATRYAAYRHAMTAPARSMHERLANRAFLFMCQACDMEQPTHDDTRLESLGPVFS
jgi:hypothetical protein